MSTARQRGFTIAETLVVLVILAVTVMVAVPLVSERVRVTRVRVAAKQLTLDLRAARLKAVSNRTPIDVIVSADPVNVYRYTDPSGKIRRIRMPSGVRIASSTSPIRFSPNGSVNGGASTVLEADLPRSILERWTVTTSFLGIPRATHQRVGS